MSTLPNRRSTLSGAASSGSFGNLPGYPTQGVLGETGKIGGNQLRQLPGYRQAESPLMAQAPQTPLARQGTPLIVPQSAIVGQGAVPNPFNPLNAQQPKPAPKPYQSREKPYYLPDLPSNKPSLGQTSFTIASATDKPAVTIQDDLPSTSLYDDPLSPERRFYLEPSGPQPASIQHSAFSASPRKFPDLMASPSRQLPQLDLTASSLTAPIPTGAHPLDNWVTVFGFSGPYAAATLAYFKSLGPIISTELGQRNWLHIRYENLLSAQKALMKNGTIIPSAGSCMIGVIPTKIAKEQVDLASESFMSPLKGTSGAQSHQQNLPIRPSALQNVVAATPGCPQQSMYTSHRIDEPSSHQNDETDIFVHNTDAAKRSADRAVGEEGPLTKAFNYIFGF